MFSIRNNDPEKIMFVFSDGLENTLGAELARNILKKGEMDINLNTLELITRRSVFQSYHRRKVEKLCLKTYRLIKNFTKSEMKDYNVEISEEWNVYNTSMDVSKAFVTKKRGFDIEKAGENYKAYPTYFPLYLKN